MNNKCTTLSLTKAVINCQKTGENKEAVLTQCSLFVFCQIQRNPLLDEDMKQDFYLSFLPYLKKLIGSFHFQGVPFEAVLGFILKRRLKSFLRSLRRSTMLWALARDESFASVYEPESPLFTRPHAGLAAVLGVENGLKGNQTARKRFLIWTLRQVRYLSLMDYPEIARLTGFSEQWIWEKAEALRESIQPREQRLMRLSERRNKLFLEARLLEMRIVREFDEEMKRFLLQRLGKKRTALLNIMRRISRIPLAPTHQAIARIIGIPRGSVNTALARLRRVLNARLEERVNRTA